MIFGVTWSMLNEKPVVSNSSPLIWLAKTGKIDLLRTIFGVVTIPRRVYEETSLGRSADSTLISKAVEYGWIKVSEENLEDEVNALAERAGIHLGEAEAILLARELDADLIIDEGEGSVTAQIFGVKPLGTIAILLLAHALSRLTFNEFKENLDNLIAQGFWLSVDVYNRILEEARELPKRKTNLNP